MPPKRRDNLPTAPANLAGLTDAERKIGGGPVYDLSEIKAHVAELQINGLELVNVSVRAALEDELRWRMSDVCKFIACLERRHYHCSEWVYASDRARIAHPADVYLMGYSRFKAEEWIKQNPWNYFKFAFGLESNTVDIYSLHPSVK